MASSSVAPGDKPSPTGAGVVNRECKCDGSRCIASSRIALLNAFRARSMTAESSRSSSAIDISGAAYSNTSSSRSADSSRPTNSTAANEFEEPSTPTKTLINHFALPSALPASPFGARSSFLLASSFLLPAPCSPPPAFCGLNTSLTGVPTGGIFSVNASNSNSSFDCELLHGNVKHRGAEVRDAHKIAPFGLIELLAAFWIGPKRAAAEYEWIRHRLLRANVSDPILSAGSLLFALLVFPVNERFQSPCPPAAGTLAEISPGARPVRRPPAARCAPRTPSYRPRRSPHAPLCSRRHANISSMPLAEANLPVDDHRLLFRIDPHRIMRVESLRARRRRKRRPAWPFWRRRIVIGRFRLSSCRLARRHRLLSSRNACRPKE